MRLCVYQLLRWHSKVVADLVDRMMFLIQKKKRQQLEKKKKKVRFLELHEWTSLRQYVRVIIINEDMCNQLVIYLW